MTSWILHQSKSILIGAHIIQSASVENHLILGTIDLTSHDGNNLWDVEGQVLDDSKNNNITKEDDGDVNLISNREIPIHDYTL